MEEQQKKFPPPNDQKKVYIKKISILYRRNSPGSNHKEEIFKEEGNINPRIPNLIRAMSCFQINKKQTKPVNKTKDYLDTKNWHKVDDNLQIMDRMETKDGHPSTKLSQQNKHGLKK